MLFITAQRHAGLRRTHTAFIALAAALLALAIGFLSQMPIVIK